MCDQYGKETEVTHQCPECLADNCEKCQAGNNVKCFACEDSDPEEDDE